MKEKYKESKVTNKMIYAPVEYMMNNLKRQVGGMVQNAVGEAADSAESYTLHREGVFLYHVQGDNFYDYFLHYEGDVLVYYVVSHKITQKTEGWTLFWDTNRTILQRVEHEIIYEEQQTIVDAPNAPYEGYGSEIDHLL